MSSLLVERSNGRESCLRLFALMVLVVGCGSRDRQEPRPSPTREAYEAMASGPEAVVRLYARLDTAGSFTCYGCDAVADSTRDLLVCWIPSAECSTDGPAWDVALVASSYSVRLDSLTPSHATATVQYRLVGQVSGGEVSLGADSLEWHPRLEPSKTGWRITGVESQRPPILSVRSALRLARTSADSTLLARLIP